MMRRAGEASGTRRDRGYAMAALLVALGVMSIMLGVAMQVWNTWGRRERETELVFRGEQYIQAINLFSRQNGGFPTSLNVLRDGKFIRRLYKDPITNEDFQPVYLGQVASGQVGTPTGRGAGPPAPTGRGRAGLPAGVTPGSGAQAAGPIIGVVSRSSAESLRQYNGRGRYNEWLFVSTAATQQAGGPAGAQNPGAGRGGRGAQPGRGTAPAGGIGGQRGQAPRGGGLNPLSPFPGPPQSPALPGRGRP